MRFFIDQQLHGYKDGHQKLEGSISLSRSDQDVIDKLSDISGPLRPGEHFEPYLTAYPLPSKQFYVIARTKQDLHAPRAGCVLTRSFLIPMKGFKNSSDLLELFLLLDIENEIIDYSTQIEVSNSNRLLEAVSDSRLSELVEVIFLEDSQPILMLDTSNAKSISIRLLSSLWPALRTKFSFCTYALGPRTVGGEPFSLLFAPSNVRGRYSKWNGRIIQGKSQDKAGPRHRWTTDAVTDIFQASHPTLLNKDFLGVMKNDEEGDESIYRLSCLWNELIEKAKTTPTAVLGLLDILNSRQNLPDNILEHLSPLIIGSIHRAPTSINELETWKFYNRLLRKFPKQPSINYLLDLLKIEATNLAKRKPIDAVHFLIEAEQDKTQIPQLLVAAIGEGVPMSNAFPQAIESLTKLTKLTSQMLLGSSVKLTKYILDYAIKLPTDNLMDWILAVLSYEGGGKALKRQIRENALPFLDESDDVPLLQALLRNVSGDGLTNAVEMVWQTSKFRVAEFDHVFQGLMHDAKDVDAIRTGILLASETENSNRFLFSTLRASTSDIDWLLNSNELSTSRSHLLILKLLLKAKTSEINKILQNKRSSKQVESICLSNLPDAAKLFADIISRKTSNTNEVLKQCVFILPFLTSAQKKPFLNKIFPVLLSKSTAGTRKSFNKLLKLSFDSIEIENLLNWSLKQELNIEILTNNIVWLGQLKGAHRNSLIDNFKLINCMLIDAYGARFPGKGLEAWAKLFRKTLKENPKTIISPARDLFNYVVRCKDQPVENLIKISYGVIYKFESDKYQPNSSFGRFFRNERKNLQRLRLRLIDAFTDSQWSPAELLMAGVNAGDPQSILRDMKKRHRGEKYLVKVIRDIERFPAKEQAILISEFDKFI
ncbi:MAG: hypothetical protein JKY84_11680 [Emcibacteraceae bacterium]|nr:hypothetical protein [Emcibacteraceae bacterium]